MISLGKQERRGNTEHLTKFNVLKGVDFNVCSPIQTRNNEYEIHRF